MSGWLVFGVSFVGGLVFLVVCCIVSEWAEDRKLLP